MLVRDNGGSWEVFYFNSDYLGSITHVVNSAGAVVAEYSYDAWGRLRDPNTHAVYAVGGEPELFLGRGYTGHEHLPPFSLINMNARLYDPVNGRMLSPDKYVPTPFGTQGYNRYSYANNNPLVYVDKDGNFWFIPIIAAALIGGTTSGLVSVASGGNFWKAFAYGAVGGAISGGFSVLGTTLGTLGQSFAYNVMSNVASTVGTNIAFGNQITGGTLLGAVGGGLLGGALGNFTGVKGGALLNGVAEIGYNSLKGSITGAFGGGLGALIDGKDVDAGMRNGAKYGAIGGAVSSGLMIAGFGAAIKPSSEFVQNKIAATNKFFGLSNSYAPVFRRGGLYNAFVKIFSGFDARGVTWGRNLVVPDNEDETYVHEYMHYVQQVKTGFGTMQGKGIIEQVRASISNWFFEGKYDPYTIPGTNEFQASWWTNYFSTNGGSEWWFNGGFKNYK